MTNMVIVFWVAVMFFKIIVDAIYANKLQEIADAKNCEISVWGITFALVLFTSVFGMIASAIMVSAIPNKEEIETEDENENYEERSSSESE